MNDPMSFNYLTTIFISSSFIIYLSIVKYLRFQNRDRLLKRFSHFNSASSLKEMTYEESREISRILIELDCPYISHTSLSLALFQTYSVPTISSLLNKTGRLTSSSCVGKRAEDTACLLTELQIFGLFSQRGSSAISRINFLHSIYSTSISQDDLLFTLSLFIFEPSRLIDRLEWRTSTELERYARFVLWSHIGQKMGIQHVPQTPDGLLTWLKVYKSKSVIFDKSNVLLGESTIDLFTRPYPNFLKPFLRKSIIYFLPDDIRHAFGWSNEIPSYISHLIPIIFKIRSFCLLHLTLPRRTPFDFGLRDPKSKNPSIDEQTTFYQRSNWLYEPWYVKKTFWNQLWSFLGFSVPSSEFQEEGYQIHQLGPKEFSKLGHSFVHSHAASIRESNLQRHSS
ncbi:hypothetical protein DFH28DRAFT_608352 [Melampsora americana]|nr:hypothetical protein DFH28DRAFT_608352 [Melampsora americana]